METLTEQDKSKEQINENDYIIFQTSDGKEIKERKELFSECKSIQNNLTFMDQYQNKNNKITFRDIHSDHLEILIKYLKEKENKKINTDYNIETALGINATNVSDILNLIAFLELTENDELEEIEELKEDKDI